MGDATPSKEGESATIPSANDVRFDSADGAVVDVDRIDGVAVGFDDVGRGRYVRPLNQ